MDLEINQCQCPPNKCQCMNPPEVQLKDFSTYDVLIDPSVYNLSRISQEGSYHGNQSSIHERSIKQSGDTTKSNQNNNKNFMLGSNQGQVTFNNKMITQTVFNQEQFNPTVNRTGSDIRQSREEQTETQSHPNRENTRIAQSVKQTQQINQLFNSFQNILFHNCTKIKDESISRSDCACIEAKNQLCIRGKCHNQCYLQKPSFQQQQGNQVAVQSKTKPICQGRSNSNSKQEKSIRERNEGRIIHNTGKIDSPPQSLNLKPVVSQKNQQKSFYCRNKHTLKFCNCKQNQCDIKCCACFLQGRPCHDQCGCQIVKCLNLDEDRAIKKRKKIRENAQKEAQLALIKKLSDQTKLDGLPPMIFYPPARFSQFCEMKSESNVSSHKSSGIMRDEQGEQNSQKEQKMKQTRQKGQSISQRSVSELSQSLLEMRIQQSESVKQKPRRKNIFECKIQDKPSRE